MYACIIIYQETNIWGQRTGGFVALIKVTVDVVISYVAVAVVVVIIFPVLEGGLG